ncbi:MAG: YicC family protein [Lentisphaerae bacterium]|nr:YicC family protein [Lentisphaerota bacterium]
MNSMTGYGFSEHRCSSGVTFSVEVFSVNKKNLELRVSLPKEALQLEPFVRQIASKRLSRGFITIRINIKAEESFLKDSVKINEPLAHIYLKKIRNMQERHDILPGVIEDDLESSEFMKSEEDLTLSVNAALDKLMEMRVREGESLKKDIENRISFLETIVAKVKPMAEKIPELQKEQLLKRLNESGLQIDSNDERLLRELVIFSDKSDVTEELTRLKSHFKQFREFMNKKEACGRSLDFLTQELQREITTVGNKALQSEITPLIVEFKTELEKIREQIQNIE